MRATNLIRPNFDVCASPQIIANLLQIIFQHHAQKLIIQLRLRHAVRIQRPRRAGARRNCGGDCVDHRHATGRCNGNILAQRTRPHKALSVPGRAIATNNLAQGTGRHKALSAGGAQDFRDAASPRFAPNPASHYRRRPTDSHPQAATMHGSPPFGSAARSVKDVSCTSPPVAKPDRVVTTFGSAPVQQQFNGAPLRLISRLVQRIPSKIRMHPARQIKLYLRRRPRYEVYRAVGKQQTSGKSEYLPPAITTPDSPLVQRPRPKSMFELAASTHLLQIMATPVRTRSS